MDNQTAAQLLAKVREKRAGIVSELLPPSVAPEHVAHPFATALQNMAESNLRSEALGDVAKVGITGLGIGAGVRGLLGLANMAKKNLTNNKPKDRHGATVLTLPIPVEEHQTPEAMATRAGSMKAASITQKASIPWYGPATVIGGLGGLALGWKGIDGMLKSRAEKERKNELDAARDEFHQALLGQYDQPLKHKLASETTTMEKVGQELDALYDTMEKLANLDDIKGMLAGGYGTYAGLSGLMAGALVYDKMQKRSRRAILQKALQRRDRRKFNQSPTQIHAVPVPMPQSLDSGAEDEIDAIRTPSFPSSTKLGFDTSRG